MSHNQEDSLANVNDMSPVIQRLLRTCHVVRSKCYLSILLWSIAIWIVVFQLYHHVLSPSRTEIVEGQHPQKRDVSSEDTGDSQSTLKDVVGMVRYSPAKDSPITTQNLSDLQAPKNHTRNRAEEEAKLLLLKKLVTLLFPSKELAMDGSKSENDSEVGYYYPGREWRDTAGNPIQAHGGGVLYVPDTHTFYWYGENKGGRTYHLRKRGTARVSPSDIFWTPLISI